LERKKQNFVKKYNDWVEYYHPGQPVSEIPAGRWWYNASEVNSYDLDDPVRKHFAAEKREIEKFKRRKWPYYRKRTYYTDSSGKQFYIG
jgi:hypothetical protein